MSEIMTKQEIDAITSMEPRFFFRSEQYENIVRAWPKIVEVLKHYRKNVIERDDWMETFIQ